MAMSKVTDDIDALLLDAAHVADDSVDVVGISKRWLSHPRLAWLTYVLGLGQPPVVTLELCAMLDPAYMWLSIYGDDTVGHAFEWGQLSPLGSVACLPYEVHCLHDRIAAWRVPVPQKHDSDTVTLAATVNCLSFAFAIIAFQCFAVIDYWSSLIFSICGISTWIAVMLYHARARSLARMDCVFMSMLVLLVIATVRCVLMVAKLT